MTSRDFAFWLQGFFELRAATPAVETGLDANQTQMIRRHLALVFIHEIDPTLKAANQRLEDLVQKIHDGHMHQPKPVQLWPNPPQDGGPLMRC